MDLRFEPMRVLPLRHLPCQGSGAIQRAQWRVKGRLPQLPPISLQSAGDFLSLVIALLPIHCSCCCQVDDLRGKFHEPSYLKLFVVFVWFWLFFWRVKHLWERPCSPPQSCFHDFRSSIPASRTLHALAKWSFVFTNIPSRGWPVSSFPAFHLLQKPPSLMLPAPHRNFPHILQDSGFIRTLNSRARNISALLIPWVWLQCTLTTSYHHVHPCILWELELCQLFLKTGTNSSLASWCLIQTPIIASVQETSTQWTNVFLSFCR
jgi:hypothetical protein